MIVVALAWDPRELVQFDGSDGPRRNPWTDRYGSPSRAIKAGLRRRSGAQLEGAAREIFICFSYSNPSQKKPKSAKRTTPGRNFFPGLLVYDCKPVPVPLRPFLPHVPHSAKRGHGSVKQGAGRGLGGCQEQGACVQFSSRGARWQLGLGKS